MGLQMLKGGYRGELRGRGGHGAKVAHKRKIVFCCTYQLYNQHSSHHKVQEIELLH